MLKATDSAINRDDTDSDDSDATVAEGSGPAAGASLAARVAGLELDTATLEMLMAALTADVCDQVETATT